MKLTLIREKTYKNGSAKYVFSCDSEFVAIVKNRYNQTKYSEKLGRLFILSSLHDQIKKVLLEDLDKIFRSSLKLNGITKGDINAL